LKITKYAFASWLDKAVFPNKLKQTRKGGLVPPDAAGEVNAFALLSYQFSLLS
jgi:hypothetical protein